MVTQLKALLTLRLLYYRVRNYIGLALNKDNMIAQHRELFKLSKINIYRQQFQLVLYHLHFLLSVKSILHIRVSIIFYTLVYLLFSIEPRHLCEDTMIEMWDFGFDIINEILGRKERY